MTVTMGANLQDLQALAQQFAQSAEQLRTIRATLNQRVVNNQGWRGGDADRFKAQWGTHDSAMALVAGSLDTGSRQLIDNVREQEQASDQATGSPGGGGPAGPGGSPGSGGAGGPGGTGGSGGDDGGWLDEAIEASSVAVGLGLKIKDTIGLITNADALIDSKRVLDVANGLRAATFADDFANASRLGQALRWAGPAFAPLAIAGGIHDMIDPAHSGALGVGDRIAGGLSVIGGGGTLLMAAGMLNPVGATIVIGAGLAAGAWAAGTYIYDNWDNISDFTGNAVDAVGDFTSDRVDDVTDAVGDVADNVGEFMDDPIGSLGGMFS